MNNIIRDINASCNLTNHEIELINFNHINEVFIELEDIYEHNDKYDMRWAFDNASQKMQSIYETEITNLFAHHLVVESNESVHEEITHVKKIAKDRVCSLNNTFSQVLFSTKIIEIVVAFFVIMFIHYLTDIFAHRYSTIVSITVITIIFAFFKIFLEHAIVDKLMYKRELYLYRKSIDKTKKIFELTIIFYFELSRIDHTDLTKDQKLKKLRKTIIVSHKNLSKARNAR
jgi:hypothetical protein